MVVVVIVVPSKLYAVVATSLTSTVTEPLATAFFATVTKLGFLMTTSRTMLPHAALVLMMSSAFSDDPATRPASVAAFTSSSNTLSQSMYSTSFSIVGIIVVVVDIVMVVVEDVVAVVDVVVVAVSVVVDVDESNTRQLLHKIGHITLTIGTTEQILEEKSQASGSFLPRHVSGYFCVVVVVAVTVVWVTVDVMQLLHVPGHSTLKRSIVAQKAAGMVPQSLESGTPSHPSLVVVVDEIVVVLVTLVVVDVALVVVEDNVLVVLLALVVVDDTVVVVVETLVDVLVTLVVVVDAVVVVDEIVVVLVSLVVVDVALVVVEDTVVVDVVVVTVLVVVLVVVTDDVVVVAVVSTHVRQ